MPPSDPAGEPHPVPALVTLHLWGVPARAIPAAFARMGTDRGPVRRTPGLRFAKLLGTGDERTFTVRDAVLAVLHNAPPDGDAPVSLATAVLRSALEERRDQRIARSSR